MSGTTRTFFLSLTLMSLLGFNDLLGQTTSIQFNFNMNQQTALGKFEPASEYVDIAGTFNGWGNPSTLLADDDGDGIYSASVNLSIGSTIEFKARINGAWDGREEFPGAGPNRSYTVIANDVVDFWYNDEFPDGVLQADFTASNTLIVPGQVVQYYDASNGTPISWEWSFPGGNPLTSTEQNPVVSYPQEGVYDVSLTVTDVEGSIEAKTKASYIRVGIKETYWWNDAVFYEVFVRSFFDQDGDGKGDFRGLIEKLDYLNDGNPATHTDLGITGIWLMPIQQSPSYHGYDVTDYRTIENDYGTNEEFKEFVAEAHKRGINIIIDYVMNHSSSEHPWFVESKSIGTSKRDWYRWSDTNPGHIGPWGQTVWHSSGGDYYYGIFWGGMPDINYESAETKAEMFDISRFWLEDMNVDGFRLDAVKYIYENGPNLEDLDETYQFWRDFRTYYKSVNPDAFAVGEAWTSTEKVSKYVENDGLDYCFEFDLASAILNTTSGGVASGLTNQVEKVMTAYPYLQFGSFLTNHDMNRVMDVFNGNKEMARQASQLLLTLPGVPYIYYGEEIGMVGSKPDEDIRTPLQWNGDLNAGFTQGNPWRAPKPDYPVKNIELQQQDNSSLWHNYRQFISFRNNQVALRKGNYSTITTNSTTVVSFLRQFEAENIIVVSNVSNDLVSSLEISLPFAEISPGSYVLVDLLSGSTANLTVDANGGFSSQLIGNVEQRSTFVYKLMSPDATTADINYNVDMRTMIKEDHFDPASESVDMASNLNGFGSTIMQLKDIDGDSIYSITVNTQDIGSTIEYKYRIEGGIDGREEFMGSDYLRRYIVQDVNNVILDTYQQDIILGIEDDQSFALAVYPNPAKEELFIELSNPPHSTIQLFVHHINGRVIKKHTFNSSKFILDVSGMPSGIYYVNLYNGTERIAKKIIVQN